VHTRYSAGPAAPPPQAPRPGEEEAPADYKPKTVTLGDIASLWVTNIAQTCVHAACVWPRHVSVQGS
jgi:hypothetical protein